MHPAELVAKGAVNGQFLKSISLSYTPHKFPTDHRKGWTGDVDGETGFTAAGNGGENLFIQDPLRWFGQEGARPAGRLFASAWKQCTFGVGDRSVGRCIPPQAAVIDIASRTTDRLIIHVPSGERRSRAQDQRQGSLTGEICCPVHTRVSGPDVISPPLTVSVWNQICHGLSQRSRTVISQFWVRCERLRGEEDQLSKWRV